MVTLATVYDRAGIADSPAVRRWALVAVIDACGTGLLSPLVIIYFTQRVGIAPVAVGGALSLAGLCSVALLPIGGVLIDRWGAKPVVLLAYCAAAVGTLSYLFTKDLPTLVAAVLLSEMADAPGRPAKHSFIAQISEGEQRQRLLAFNRSVRNAGYGIGGLLAALVLLLNTDGVFLGAIVLDAASFAVAALIVRTIQPPVAKPRRSELDEPEEPNRSQDPDGSQEPNQAAGSVTAAPAGLGGYRPVFADWRYVLLAALNVPVLLEANVLIVGLPIWLVRHTSAPTALVGVLFTVNTVMIVLFQVVATKGLAGPSDAAPVYRRAAGAFVLAAICYFFAGQVGALLAGVLMTAAVLLHSLTELNASAGEWAVSIGLAPDALRGRYLSLWAAGDIAAKAVGPVLVALLLEGLTSAGWIVLGGLIAGACLATAALAPRHPRAAVLA
jgi:MFS family permease